MIFVYSKTCTKEAPLGVPPVLCTTFKVRASVYTDSCNAVQTIHTASIVFRNRQ